MWPRRLRVGLVVAVVGAAVGAWLAREVLTPRAGVGVARDAAPVRGLLANAPNVTYYLRPPAAYYEFDTDEGTEGQRRRRTSSPAPFRRTSMAR